MSFRHGFVLFVASWVLLLAACGNNSPSRKAAPRPPATSVTANSTATGNATGTAPSAPRKPAPTGPTASGPELPATFTIEASGALSPSTVSGPGSTPVLLTVISGDHRAHHVVVHGKTLSVPAGGRAALRLAGLANGSYPVAVDGAKRGTMIIGVAPGP